MEYGIQRRSVYLVPPDGEDLTWIFKQLEVPAIAEMFGHDAASRTRIRRAQRKGDLILGVIRLAASRKRIGFILVYPPAGGFDFWEFSYAVPDPSDRDAYSALNASDAMLHYLFEHLRIEAIGWRVRVDNAASDAVVRRIGYKPFTTRTVDGHDYVFYRLAREGWDRRREKLVRGEEKFPSGIGDTFLTLTYPFTPVVPKT